MTSCIAMACDDPLGDPSSTRALVLWILNLIFTVIFIIEGILKVKKGLGMRLNQAIITLHRRLLLGSFSTQRIVRKHMSETSGICSTYSLFW